MSADEHKTVQADHGRARQGIQDQIRAFIDDWSKPPEVRACRRDGYCLMHVLVFNLTEGFIDTLCRRKSTDVTTFDTVTLLVVVL
jgi:hypothetical protein